MKKTIFFCTASLFAAWAGNVYADGWTPVLINTSTDQVFTAKTAGKSGNVKACFQQTITTNTFQWQHDAGGTIKTRGTFDEVTVTDSVQVDNSLCEPQT